MAASRCVGVCTASLHRRLREQLLRYFPAFLELEDDLDRRLEAGAAQACTDAEVPQPRIRSSSS